MERVQSAGLSWAYELYRISQDVADEGDARVRQKILECVVSGTGATSGAMALLDESGSQLTIVAGIGRAAQFIGSTIALGDEILGWVAQEGTPLLLNGDVSSDPRFRSRQRHADSGARPSAMCFPLKIEKRVIGALSLNRSPEEAPFTQQDLGDAGAMVQVASVVLDNADLRAAQQGRIAELDAVNRELQGKRRSLEMANARQRESETRLAAILDIAPEAIVSVDDQQRIILFNKGAELTFGYAADEVAGKPLTMLLPEAQAAAHARHIEEFARSTEKRRDMQRRNPVAGRRKDGTLFPAEAAISHVTMDGKRIFIAIVRDISEQRVTDEMRMRLSAILENTTDLVCTTDIDGRLLTLNRAGRELLSIGETQAIETLKITDFFSSWSVTQFQHESRPYTLRDGNWHGESEMQLASGREVPVLQLMQVHRPANGAAPFLSISIRDISEQKQHEEELHARLRELEEAKARIEQTQTQLLQSDKMASIGQLAAGVAHEINNPVGYVNSNLGTLQRYIADLFRVLDAYAATEAELPPGSDARAQLLATKESVDIGYLRDDVQQLVKESQDGLKRVKQIVQDLKDFSHVDEAEWQWTDLHKGLDSTLNIVHNEVKYKAEVVKNYGTLPQVECLPSQLNQVFMNMMVNAAHAIEERGTITLSSGQQGEEVWVDIADSGKGIAPQHIKRIFDPFFTTKPVGKGTGLGLSLSYGIVQKHGGRIEVRSEVGKGTAFRIWLPVKQAETKAAA